MINHISFDLDGTLIDSIPLMKASWENVCSTLGLKIGWSVYRNNIGLPFDRICENLDILSIKDEVRELYFEFNKRNVDMIKPMQGLEECLRWLDVNKVEWSIITSKPKYTTTDILNRFQLTPKVLVTADDTLTGKPTTAPAQLLKSNLDSSDRNFFYVGDTLIDHLFAINSDFQFVEFIDEKNSLFDKKYIKSKANLICNPRLTITSLKNIEYIF